MLACGGGGGGSDPGPQPPRITSGPTATGISTAGATITWTTDKSSNSIVKYGESSAYTDSVSSATMVVSHSVPITGLNPLQTYNFSVASEDADGRRVTSVNRTFQTLSPVPGLVDEGWTLFSQDSFDEALEKFRDAYAYEPENVDVLEGIGWAMLRLYRFEAGHPESLSSRKAFDDALAIQPRRLDCLAGEAFLFQALGMHSEAAGRALDVLSESGNDYDFEHDPDISTSDVRYCYTVSEIALGDFEEALAMARVLDPSIDLDPDDASTWDGHLSFEEALVVVVEGLRDRV
jgi:tetratricopeptide (TPR) repeat protein